MPSNIKHNSVRDLRFRCRNDEYYDFMLYRGEAGGVGDGCLVSKIDPSGISGFTEGEQIRRVDKEGKPTYTGGEVFANLQWSGARNENTILKDIGLTGIDNGFIAYRRDLISNREFIDMYTGTTYPVSSTTFYMSPVSGNTRAFEYPMTLESDGGGQYFSMKGGFFQGFYKLHGFEYQTLPSYINDDWTLEFMLRRKDYPVGEKTLNNLHPENNGMFFYMGTRAENKFWQTYNNVEDKAEFLLPSVFDDEYFDNCLLENYVTVVDYTEYQSELVDCTPFEGYVDIDEDLIDPKAWCDDYWEKDIDLADVKIRTSLGLDLDQRGYYEMETDNKFIFFNRTCTGFTVNDWDEHENDYTYDDCNNIITPNNNPKQTVIFTGITDNCKENKFITYNRTCTGKTVNSDQSYQYQYEAYDVYKDIKDNAFGLRIDENGRIGYRYGTVVCESEDEHDEIIKHHYGVKEEYSRENIIPFDKWVKVDVRFKIVNPTNTSCINKYGEVIPNKLGKRKMKIYIYVNGYLVFISQELDEFRFREFDDIYQKQEGVPFSISLGGGTQGLLEEIELNYYKTSEYCLPIERDFAGTFLGDIRYFKFFDCFVDPQSMRD